MFSKFLIAYFEASGKYFLMLKESCKRPQNHKIFFKECFYQCKEFVVRGSPIIFVISIFAGAVATVQIASQLSKTMFVPPWLAGRAARDTIFLEITPTFNGIVLAGVIGSKLTSEIGNMRLTEQIDALEIMGINSKTLLIMPRIMSIIFITPFLSVFSLVLSILGGRYAGMLAGILNPVDFDEGFFTSIKFDYIMIGGVKSFLYAFIYSSLGCYFGYYVKGGAIEIGKATTQTVIVSCILILLTDYAVTSIFL